MVTKKDIQMAADRLAICEKCEWYLKLPKMCRHCGCLMPFKVKIKAAGCPMRKW